MPLQISSLNNGITPDTTQCHDTEFLSQTSQSGNLTIISTTQAEHEKSTQRDANTARAGCSKVQTPPACLPIANTQTHRQDRLQYTIPQLASAQCNKMHTTGGTTNCCMCLYFTCNDNAQHQHGRQEYHAGTDLCAIDTDDAVQMSCTIMVVGNVDCVCAQGQPFLLRVRINVEHMSLCCKYWQLTEKHSIVTM